MKRSREEIGSVQDGEEISKSNWKTIALSLVYKIEQISVKLRESEAEIVRMKMMEQQRLEKKRWQREVPVDILSNISDRLPILDYIKFRSICLSWRSMPSPRSSIFNFSKHEAWLMVYDLDENERDKCLIYDLSAKKMCSFKLQGLQGATCLTSAHGWLLACRGNHYFFYNPFSYEEIRLPDHPCSTTAFGAVFSEPPTSRDCITLVVHLKDAYTVDVRWCRVGANRWNINTVSTKSQVALSNGDCEVTYFMDIAGKRTAGISTNYLTLSHVFSEESCKFKCSRRDFIEPKNLEQMASWVRQMKACHGSNEKWMQVYGNRGVVFSIAPPSWVFYRPGHRAECKKPRYTAQLFVPSPAAIGNSHAEIPDEARRLKAIWVDPVLH